MIRKLILSCAFLCFLPGIAHALALGHLELRSKLNQQFDARIKLYSVPPGQLEDFTAQLAGKKAFERAGLERSFVLTTLRFELIEDSDGLGYIKITTPNYIKEPYLNFIVEVDGPAGRILREYSVLFEAQ